MVDLALVEDSLALVKDSPALIEDNLALAEDNLRSIEEILGLAEHTLLVAFAPALDTGLAAALVGRSKAHFKSDKY